MKTVYFSLGSNQGDRLAYLQTAINEINSRVGKIQAISNVYQSEPVGFDSNDLFLNACCSATTTLEPSEILKCINTIEYESGRVRLDASVYSSRTLDIDIIFIDNIVVQTEELIIPHQHFRERQFVLKPLNDLAKDFIDPETKFTVEHLLKICPDKSKLSKYELSLFI